MKASHKPSLQQFVASPFYAQWRERVEDVGGCAYPVRLHGSTDIRESATGALVTGRSGGAWVRCGTRRANVCPPCSALYAQDAFHVVRAGMTGDDAKNVSTAVADAPAVFATLTAPSFGAVHSRRVSKQGKVMPCSCRQYHSDHDTRLGHAVDVDAYDYEAAVLWQAHAGALWGRWCTRVRRRLAALAGVRAKDLKDHAILSFAKVAEFQKRGLVHFHAVVRIDGPDGPGSAAPDWATPQALEDAVRAATAEVCIDIHRPTGELLSLTWGKQVTVDRVGGDDETSAPQLAGYVAKYATKDSGATDSGVDKRFRDREDIEMLRAAEHHKRMMLTAWDLGDLDSYAHLNLRRWTHMLAFRGHFLTKSRLYSTTFRRLRDARARARLVETLDAYGFEPCDVVVMNDWAVLGIGYDTPDQAELAAAIGQAHLARKQSRKE